MMSLRRALADLKPLISKGGPPILIAIFFFLLFFSPIVTLIDGTSQFFALAIAKALSDQFSYELFIIALTILRITLGVLTAIILIYAATWVMRLAATLGYRTQVPNLPLPTFQTAPSIAQSEPNARERIPMIVADLYLADKPLLGIQNARLRLESHVTSLRNASILNLFAGIAIAVVGISVLYTVFVDIEKFRTLAEQKVEAVNFLVFGLVPRLSATLFIQIFAYFFLLMYRSNLSDVRYFQNEMSNLDLYGTAVSLALKPNVSATEKGVISALLKVERNRVMNKNQKTINPADDTEMHAKSLSTLSQSVTALSKALSKWEKQ